MGKEYKDLKFKWYSAKRRGNLYEADQIKHQMKLWKKNKKKLKNLI